MPDERGYCSDSTCLEKFVAFDSWWLVVVGEYAEDMSEMADSDEGSEIEVEIEAVAAAGTEAEVVADRDDVNEAIVSSVAGNLEEEQSSNPFFGPEVASDSCSLLVS